ncbi:MAG: response regulator [Planctomycetota bacterium]
MATTSSALVIVVDDELTVRSTARAILTRAGHEVHSADNGRAALALLTGLGRAADVVVLDWTLPDLPGAILLSEIRRLSPRCRVIVSTGFGREDLMLPPSEVDAVQFLEKPYTAAALVAAVAATLGAECSQDPTAGESGD